MLNNNKHLNRKIKIIIIKFKKRNRFKEIINLENSINKKILTNKMTIINKKIISHKKTIFLLEIEKENKKNKRNINLHLNTNQH